MLNAGVSLQNIRLLVKSEWLLLELSFILVIVCVDLWHRFGVPQRATFLVRASVWYSAVTYEPGLPLLERMWSC